jgi:hypothetical protein
MLGTVKKCSTIFRLHLNVVLKQISPKFFFTLRCVEAGVVTALALGSFINMISFFDRKVRLAALINIYDIEKQVFF